MRNKFRELEEEVEKYWKERKIPEKALRKRGDKGKFYFLDGPPYVTNPVHVGTAWNKILKDFVLRYKRMRSYTVWSKPGFDTHGLPIEVMVETRLGIKRKKQIVEEIGLERFNEECKKIVNENLRLTTKQFVSLGVWLDWDDPYITLTNKYISSIWWGIKRIYEKGFLSRERRIFHWCPRCETVLSEHEVAQGYRDTESPSIYVKFPVIGRQSEYILIWTTTPWTLPSNVAVMVHPSLTYVRVKLKRSQETYILLKSRLREVLREKYEVLEEFKGERLRGLNYEPPLLKEVPEQGKIENAHRVVLSKRYVTGEQGTGCVHIAPEHGKEDFEVSVENKLPHVVLVNDEGKFTEKAGKYRGKYIFDVNEEIISDLERKNLIYRKEKILHKYPHCWRCKMPLFLRSTSQWVIKLSNLRDELLRENEKINWIPDWAGRQRFKDWIKEARDWVISRQRFWGTPLPIWICSRCGKIEVIGSSEELEEKTSTKVDDLHIPFVDKAEWRCSCGGIFRRIPEVLDVWVDSGSASWASLGYPDEKEFFERLWPVDFIVEGHDQTRGWFYALLALGLVIFGKTPYRTVLMHGFTLDPQGKPMHKSLGNVIYPEELVDKYGKDVLRVFLLKNTVWRDLPVSFKELNNVLRELEIVMNIYQFYSLYARLDGFSYPGEGVFLKNYGSLPEEDKWIISVFEETFKEVEKEFDRYYIHEGVRRILKFAVDELSRKYLKMIRRRVWVEAGDWMKEAAYLTLHYILKRLSFLMAPLAPFMSEYFYLHCLKPFDGSCGESVHLERWPRPNPSLINDGIEKKYNILWEIITTANSLRQRRKLKIRQPLREAIISEELFKRLSKRQIELLKKMINVIEVREIRDYDEFLDFEVHPRTEIIGPKLREVADKVSREMKRMGREIARKIIKGEDVFLTVNGREIRISREDVDVVKKPKEPYLMGEVLGGLLILNGKIDDELRLLGLLNDVIRRVQDMRKRADLDVTEYIDLGVESAEEDVLRAIKENKEFFMEEVRARTVSFSFREKSFNYVKEWKIDGIAVKIGFSRLGCPVTD